jgi:phage terminase large subunit GpA-like protein
MMYLMDINPSPTLYVQKTLDAVDLFNAQRWNPSIEVMNNIVDKMTRDTKLVKIFRGAMLKFGGANSGASLRSMPIQNLILDEEESYNNCIDDEGSPSQIAIVRTTNFINRKIFRLSTPLIKETSKIEPLYQAGTRERYHVPCPFCKHTDYMRHDRIKYTKLPNGNVDYKSIGLVCTACGALIEERYKEEMLANGQWIAENPDAEYPSFHLSILLSPIGFFSWKEYVREWEKASSSNDENLLRVFYNTRMGETYSAIKSKEHYNKYIARRESYNVPDSIVVITAGADVQENRIEMEVVGWTRNMQAYSLDYHIIMGSTDRIDVWNMLKEYLEKIYTNDSGVKIPIACAGIDSGFLATTVYKFCLPLEFRLVYPVKGMPGFGKSMLDRPMKRNKDGVFLFRINSDESKLKIYNYLRVEKPEEFGYMHFPIDNRYDENYFKMLTSETLEKIWSGGAYKLKWNLPEHHRNEALDARVYAMGALNILNLDLKNLKNIVTPNFGRVATKKRIASKGID